MKLAAIQSKPANAKRLFQSAESFREASEILRSADGVSAPYVVLAAFTAELYLKTLSVIQKDTFLMTHDLWELFRDLHPHTKAPLKKRHAKLIADDPSFNLFRRVGLRTDLEFFLDLNRLAFEQYRYQHEGNAKSAFFLETFTQCLRERIVQLRPAWSAETL